MNQSVLEEVNKLEQEAADAKQKEGDPSSPENSPEKNDGQAKKEEDVQAKVPPMSMLKSMKTLVNIVDNKDMQKDDKGKSSMKRQGTLARQTTFAEDIIKQHQNKQKQALKTQKTTAFDKPVPKQDD